MGWLLDLSVSPVPGSTWIEVNAESCAATPVFAAQRALSFGSKWQGKRKQLFRTAAGTRGPQGHQHTGMTPCEYRQH